MNQPQHQTIVIHAPGQSTLGTAGLIFSCLGWLTCGLLCIPGAAMSFLGLFSNKQKGHALVGLIVGFPGVVFFFLIGMTILLPLIGLGGLVATGAAAQAAKAQAEVAARQNQALPEATSPIEEPIAVTDTPAVEPTPEPAPVDEPKPAEPAPLVTEPAPTPMPVVEKQPIPEPAPVEPVPVPAPETSRLHTFTDSTGKFKIVAELLAFKNNWVKLKREDGKEITMPVSKLSAKDQEWIKKNAP